MPENMVIQSGRSMLSSLSELSMDLEWISDGIPLLDLQECLPDYRVAGYRKPPLRSPEHTVGDTADGHGEHEELELHVEKISPEACGFNMRCAGGCSPRFLR